MCAACAEKPIYKNEKILSSKSWSEDDPLNFDFEIADTTELYNLDLFIDHGTDYQFQNIYLEIKTVFPDGEEIANLIPVNFADRFGKWFGKCSSEACKLRVFLKQDFKFRQTGAYSIEINQKSREKELKSIHKITAALYKKQSNK